LTQRSMLRRSAQKLTSRTSQPSRGMDCRVEPGNDASFSRRLRARVMLTPISNGTTAAPSRHAASGWWDRVRLDHARQGQRRKKEKKEAERRQTRIQRPRPAGRGARSAERARLSAFHRGTCGGDRTPPLNSSHALPATVLGRNGRYPLPAVMQCSDLSRRPVIVPAGRFCPESPGSGGDEPPPAGTALAPPAAVTRPASSYEGREFATSHEGRRASIQT
jgi:hypothetical protein